MMVFAGICKTPSILIKISVIPSPRFNSSVSQAKEAAEGEPRSIEVDLPRHLLDLQAAVDADVDIRLYDGVRGSCRLP